jgi:sugar phosphate isomerase/epimerase
MSTSRRRFMRTLGLGSIAFGLGLNDNNIFASAHAPASFFEISLAEFSFASDLWSKKMDHLDFPLIAKRDYGVDIVEYVSMFFNNKHKDPAYISELKKRAADAGVKNNLIMVDGENISDLDPAKRLKAVESHYIWVDIAKTLGCQSIRVNLGAMNMPGTDESEMDASLEGYSKLLDYGAKEGINVIVENHMGRSCNGQWLASIMKKVNRKNAGVLPDFGNFCIKRTMPKTMDIAGYMATKCLEQYDMYKGIEELMPYAKGVSAKTHKFTATGEEAEMDFTRIFNIIKKSGFKGIVGIEYEGGLMRDMGKDEAYMFNSDGVKATKKLLEKMQASV